MNETPDQTTRLRTLGSVYQVWISPRGSDPVRIDIPWQSAEVLLEHMPYEDSTMIDGGAQIDSNTFSVTLQAFIEVANDEH